MTDKQKAKAAKAAELKAEIKALTAEAKALEKQIVAAKKIVAREDVKLQKMVSKVYAKEDALAELEGPAAPTT